MYSLFISNPILEKIKLTCFKQQGFRMSRKSILFLERERGEDMLLGTKIASDTPDACPMIT
jgi:hypothetical protein